MKITFEFPIKRTQPENFCLTNGKRPFTDTVHVQFHKLAKRCHYKHLKKLDFKLWKHHFYAFAVKTNLKMKFEFGKL